MSSWDDICWLRCGGESHYVFGYAVWPSVRCLSVRCTYVNTLFISRQAIAVLSEGISMTFCYTDHHVSENLLKRFSKSEVKGQGHSDVKCTFPAE